MEHCAHCTWLAPLPCPNQTLSSHASRRGKEKGPTEGPSVFVTGFGRELCSNYVLGLQTFWPLLHLELHLRTYIQRTITVRLDCRKVNEYVVAARSLDKSVALGGIKPLHDTF